MNALEILAVVSLATCILSTYVDTAFAALSNVAISDDSSFDSDSSGSSDGSGDDSSFDSDSSGSSDGSGDDSSFDSDSSGSSSSFGGSSGSSSSFGGSSGSSSSFGSKTFAVEICFNNIDDDRNGFIDDGC
jgi:hypothetical protein